jgi:hypothetical protein
MVTSVAAAGSQAEPIRGLRNPPRWPITTISIAWRSAFVAHRLQEDADQAIPHRGTGTSNHGCFIGEACFQDMQLQEPPQRGWGGAGHFDFLSTVSGGGYTGSFITSRVGGGADFGQIAGPFGPDTNAVRHLRQNAKYLRTSRPISATVMWLLSRRDLVRDCELWLRE